MKSKFKLKPESAEIMRAAVVRIIAQAKNGGKHKFHMGSWGYDPEGFNVFSVGELASLHGAKCGGSCCFYGEIALMNYEELNPQKSIDEEVSKLLEIPDSLGQTLYMADQWPDEYSQDYSEARSTGDKLGMALALEATVEEFIEEWS